MTNLLDELKHGMIGGHVFVMRIDNSLINRHVTNIANYIKKKYNIKDTRDIEVEIFRSIKDIIVRHVKINERRNND